MNTTTRELSNVGTGLEFRKPNANARPERAVVQMQETVMGILFFLALAVFWCTSAQATVGDYQTAVTNQASLISYYTFDRTNAVDNFGPNNGTVQGTVQFKTGVGDAGLGMRVNASGRVNLGRVPDFDFADTTGTVETWVRADWSGTLTYNPAICANRDGSPVTWSIHMNGDKGGVGLWNGFSYSPLNFPSAGTTWHHLAVTFDNETLTIYWDGAGLGTRPQGTGTSPSTTQLASSSASFTDEGWVGMLDEVAFYADALPADAIQAHYQALFVGTPPVITKQPHGGTYLPGVPLQLSVGATGPNLSYQWFKDGAALAGKVSATLPFGSLSIGDAGVYHVKVSNPATNVVSADVTIAVAPSLPANLRLYQQAVTNEPSLISYYVFDQLTAADRIGVTDGTLKGTADFGTGVGGGPDQGLLLDGAGHVSLGSVPAFDFSDGSGTEEAWVRADWTSIGYDPVIVSDREGGLVSWSIHMNRDKGAIGMWNGSDYRIGTIPNAGTDWHHVVMAFDAGNMTLYWDGLLVGTMAQPLGVSPANTQLGSSAADSTAEGWVGELDEVALYADALSATAVQTHYQALLAGQPPVITVEPTGGSFYTGRALTLMVGATGAGRTYQWYKDGNALSGATNWALNFGYLDATNSGTYHVAVTNSAGSTNSNDAVVQVGNDLARYQAAVRDEVGLISYYTFDASDAADTKGTNSGSLVGNVTFSAGVGQGTDNAAVLDGASHIALGQVLEFEFTNGTGTVEAWIRPDWTSDPGYDPCIFADRNGGPTDWSIHESRFRNSIGNWNGSHFQSLGVGVTAEWHHYAVAFGDGSVSMFWDGQLLGTFGQAIALSTGLTAQIGSSSPDTTGEGWIGAMDEVAFYRTTLGLDAIRSHFLAMVAPATAPAISVSRSGNQLTLSWPTDAVGFTLESADTLPTASWTTVGGVVNNQVTVVITAGNQFYRLRK